MQTYAAATAAAAAAAAMVVPLSGHLVFITVSIQSSLETKHCGSVPTVADPEDRARGRGGGQGTELPLEDL